MIILVCFIFLQQLIIAILEDMFSGKMREKKEDPKRDAKTHSLHNESLFVCKEDSEKTTSSRLITSSHFEKVFDVEENDFWAMDEKSCVNVESAK